MIFLMSNGEANFTIIITVICKQLILILSLRIHLPTFTTLIFYQLIM